jgi:putative oxidoreductase
MGVPAPSVTGPLVGTIELVGGGLLLVGLASRLVAIPLAVDMLVAMLLVHLPGGFFLPDGVELILLLFAGAVTIVLAGPGAFAVDRLIARSEHRSGSDHTRVASVWTR